MPRISAVIRGDEMVVNRALLCDPAGDLDRAWVIAEGARLSRGVLLYIPRLLDRALLEPGEAINGEHMDACCASAGLDVVSGDVVLIRTGGLAHVRERGDWGDYAGKGPRPGMSATSAAWFAERDVAAVVTDTWGFEVLPYETVDTVAPLHLFLDSVVPVRNHDWRDVRCR